MLTKRNSIGLSVLAAGALALAGCGGSSNDGNGLLTVKLTDSPVDSALEVSVVFTGIELQPADGERISIDFEENRSIDLLTLQDGVTVDLLDGEELEAGQYNWIRLKVLAGREDSQSSILLENGEEYPLWVPSGAQTGLKLVRPFMVAQGGTTELVIDFDLRKSVIAPPGLAPNYILKPTLRLVDNLLTGTVAGEVDVAYLAELQEVEACVPGVYLFAGGEVVPDDMDGEAGDDDPVVYKPLEADEVTGIAAYTIPFVEAGEYTVAFTCNFDVDALPDESEYDPNAGEEDDGFETMAWTDFVGVEVVAGETTEVDLPAAE